MELVQFEVTVPALLKTGTGKVVWSLKHKGGRVAELAKKLVTRWKRVAIEYEPPLPDVGKLLTVTSTMLAWMNLWKITKTWEVGARC